MAPAAERKSFPRRRPVFLRHGARPGKRAAMARNLIASRSRAAQAGFSLVELMVVVLIISLLAAVAVPAFARIQRKAKTAALVNDLRVFAAAFDAYAQETGAWPPEAAVSVLPPLMNGRISTAAWSRITPIGGKYNWEYNRRHAGVRYRASLAVGAAIGAPFVVDAAQMLDIDRAIDDGELTTGNFISGTGAVPVFVISRR